MADTGLVLNPFSTSAPDSSGPGIAQGRGSELLVAEIHGKYFAAAARGAMFSFNVTAQTLPVVVSSLNSKFSLYNPVGSNRLLELAFLDCSLVLVTTVVDTWGLYYQSPQVTGKGAFTTAGTAQAALLNSNYVGQGVPYSAFSHTAASITRWMNVAYFGATTTTSNAISHYAFDGRAVIPPGSLVSVATATAATTGSAADLDLSWIETTIV